MATKVFILLDADVIFHFHKAGRFDVLTTLFKERLLVLDVVLSELKDKTIRPVIERMLSQNLIREYAFPTDHEEIYEEYIGLRKKLGKGESACMAVCRFKREILASSNLRDIKPYCSEYGIAYLTTMDILAIALDKKVLTEKECDEAIAMILAKNSRLPYNNISQYLKKDFDRSKCLY